MSIILYLNGTIYTMDAMQPRAQAMAIDTASGRILAVGDNDEVRRVGDRHAELVDLRGKTVLPGFIDSHIHRCCRVSLTPIFTCSSPPIVLTISTLQHARARAT